jgi:hypothetical protein
MTSDRERLGGATPTVVRAVLLLCVAFGLHGCITATVVATIAIIKSRLSHTATVQIEKDPKTVYDTMVRIVEGRPDIKIDSKDDAKYRLKASRGKNRVDARAKLLDSGMTELTVTATADKEEQEHKDLALKVVETVCKELGVKYKVVEKKGLLRKL